MNDYRAAPIGVFDSGVGGLTVITEMIREIPRESYIYYADTAHVPYGSRQMEELKEFAASITGFLLEQSCKMIIIACNTSTSIAFDELKKKFSRPIIGVIEPGADQALRVTKNNKIGLIATEATVKSGAYQKTLLRKNPAVEVTAVACPLFVNLVEKGEVNGPKVCRAAKEYLQPLKTQGIDCLILGCTHYPYLLPVILDILGPGVTFVDPARETVRLAKKMLDTLALSNQEENPSRQYYVSGDPENFQRMGKFFLHQEIKNVRAISLD